MPDRQQEFHRNLGRLITHLNRLRKRFMSDHLRDYQLSGSLYMFLIALDRHPGASQDFLVEHFYMDKGNIARGAKRLEELGYIRREKDPNDRRQYRLFLTERSLELLPLIRSLMQKWSETLSYGFDDNERELVLNLLDRMVENGNKHFSGLE